MPSRILTFTEIDYKPTSRVVLVQYWYDGVNYVAPIESYDPLKVWLTHDFNDVISIEEENGFRTVMKVNSNQHPWTNDLRSLSQMLAGKIPIPHKLASIGAKQCEPCIKALELQSRYRAEKKAARV